jgi:hypothetical protein
MHQHLVSPARSLCRPALPRFLHPLALAACVAASCLALPALADPLPPPPPAGAMAHAHRDGAVQAKLDRLAARLEIKASQDPAWQGFTRAFRALAAQGGMAHEAAAHEHTDDADAASLARHHAEHAAERARLLAAVADATAKLQQALSPEQQHIFNEAARRYVHGGMAAGTHGGAWAHHDSQESSCEGGTEGHGMGMHQKSWHHESSQEEMHGHMGMGHMDMDHQSMDHAESNEAHDGKTGPDASH